MSIQLNKAVCLHAQADDLKFLNPVRNRMEKLLGRNFRVFSVGDQNSQVTARQALETGEGYFVIIFAHGGRDYVRGGEYVHRVTREVIEAKKFLTVQDAHVFRGKVVFCMSCDSNGLARASLAAGARAFVGFDEIPFNRFDSNGEPTGSYVLVKHCQELIVGAVRASLERFLTGGATLDEAIGYLRLAISQSAVKYVRRNTAVKEAREIAALFLRVKDGVRCHGQLDIRFK